MGSLVLPTPVNIVTRQFYHHHPPWTSSLASGLLQRHTWISPSGLQASSTDFTSFCLSFPCLGLIKFLKSEDQKVRKRKHSNAWSSGSHGWMSHEWHAPGFASKIIRLQSQPGQGSKHRYWMHQSWTLFRERRQQYLLTASSLCSKYTNIPFHHTHPNPTPAPCIPSGINMVIKDFHWQA